MTPKLKIDHLLQFIKADHKATFEYDEEKTIKEIEKHHAAYSNIIIKVLSVIGGVLAALALIGFLFLAGIYESDSGLFTIGMIFVVGSIIASKTIDHVFLDTTVITFYATGILLVAFGMMSLEIGFTTTMLVVAILSIAGIVLSRGFMMVLTSVISLNATIFIFVLERLPLLMMLPIITIGLILFILTSFESKIITSNRYLNRLYAPLQAGYFISFLCCMLYISMGNYFGAFIIYHKQVVLSLSVDMGILLMVAKIIKSVGLAAMKYIVMTYVFTLLILVCIFYAPYIAGSILLLLLSYYYGYKAQVVISFIGLLYFIFKFYYDLQMSLLVKSALLFIPGIVMITLWFYVNKQLKSNEEN